MYELYICVLGGRKEGICMCTFSNVLYPFNFMIAMQSFIYINWYITHFFFFFSFFLLSLLLLVAVAVVVVAIINRKVLIVLCVLIVY